MIPDYSKTDPAYHARELRLFFAQLKEVNARPVSERKESAEELYDACVNSPALVAERIGWLFNGSYGYYPGHKSVQIIRTMRHPNPALFNLIAHVEWTCGNHYANQVYKRLTPAQQAALNAAVSNEVSEWLADPENNEA